MTPAVVAVASLACLLLTASIYYCNILSGPRSWLRSEMLGMILLSLLVGLSPLPLAGSVLVPLNMISAPSGIGASDIPLVILAIGCLVLTALVFRALVIATYRREGASAGSSPLPPMAPQSAQPPHDGRAAAAGRTAKVRAAA